MPDRSQESDHAGPLAEEGSDRYCEADLERTEQDSEQLASQEDQDADHYGHHDSSNHAPKLSGKGARVGDRYSQTPTKVIIAA